MRVLSQISMANYFDVVKPKITERESWVLEAIEELAPCTAEMVAEHYGVGINVVSGRFTGLRKKQQIVKAYDGVNGNGNKVAYYQPKDMPLEYEND
jgi:hypothetical protein